LHFLQNFPNFTDSGSFNIGTIPGLVKLAFKKQTRVKQAKIFSYNAKGLRNQAYSKYKLYIDT